MKINEFAIINESKKVNEAPMGMLKRAGLGIASKFGSAKAAGKLETGKTANLIKKAFEKHLGATGGEASAEELIAFLKLNKYPTDGVEQLAKQMASKPQKDAMPQGPAGDAGAEKDDEKILQMPSQAEIKKFGGGESIEEADIKGKDIDKLIMKAAQDAARMKSGMPMGGGQKGQSAGMGQAGASAGGIDNKAMQKALQRLKSEAGITNANVAASALTKMAAGEQVPKQQREAVAPLLNAVGRAMQDPNGVQRLLQLIKQTNKA
jgi:hypothetical protein